MTLLLLMYEFFFTGLFAVGGGLATIPFLQAMGRKRSQWFSGAKLVDIIAASQCAPGPLGTNMAAYIGCSVARLPGALLSVAALMMPTVLSDLSIAMLLERFRHARWIKPLMKAIQPVSAALIAAAAFSLLRSSLLKAETLDFSSLKAILGGFDGRCAVLYAVMLPFVFCKKLRKLHPLLYIAAGAAVGVMLKL
ncbi:MAG: chromate transporter [Oscillospiraceae bacterium]|jgi:chromate transporter|nr:chromate transporter [Oscillospiraceae bacterium]